MAMHIEDSLGELGYSVVGPVPTIDEAIAYLETEEIDAALLDVNLRNGITSFPVARALDERSIPFAFLTGYGSKGLQEEFKDRQVLVKPVDAQLLAKTLLCFGE